MQIGIWVLILIMALVVEGCTQSLVSVWFAAGALGAVICAAFGLSLWIQIAVFLVVSGILLAILLPLIRKRGKNRRTATNADRIIGKEAVVTQGIDGIHGVGQIRVMGSTWSAKAADGGEIPEGAPVIVEKIDGVKAVVIRKEQEK